MLFQKNIIKKYLSTLDAEGVNTAWNCFKKYFQNADIQQNIRQCKEEEFQEGFLRELFVKVFGYTLKPSPDYNLVAEKQNETNAKKADGAIIIDEKVVAVIELKDLKTTDLSKIESQAFGYKNKHSNCRIVIISNFEKLRLYIDNAVEYQEWNLFNIGFEDFKELFLMLSFANVKKSVAVKMKEESISSEEQITNKLYKDYSEFKKVLYDDICANNGRRYAVDNVSAAMDLYKMTQKILDRLLFIFFAEDCGILPPNLTKKIILDWKRLADLDAYVPLYDRFKKHFGYIDTGYKHNDFEVFAYDGGLFRHDAELDSLTITDAILEKYATKLSEYDYASEVDVNILGHIFEQSLNDNGDNKRKRDGVFYTPQYITKYIIDNTIGKLCTEKKSELGIRDDEYFADKRRKKETKRLLYEKLAAYRKWLLQITILDPACGSGAFLNAALVFLIQEHKIIDEMEAKITGDSLVMPNIEISILENNLFGVDINEESVEIAKLSLWLRTAKPRRKLNSLNNNIKCGNSLISDPAVAGAKAFDWETDFPQVFANGGFDVVVGNPPYVNVNNIKNTFDKEFYKTNYKTANEMYDLYSLFTEKAKSLLKPNGLLGFIFSNSWLGIKSFRSFRQFLVSDVTVTQLVELPDKVFDEASVKTVICFYTNRKPSDKSGIEIYKYADNKFRSKGFVLPYKQILSNSNLSFSLEPVIELNRVKTIPLKNIIMSTCGIKTANDEKFVLSEKKDDCCYPFLRGRNITKWGRPCNPANEFVWYKPELMKENINARPRELDNFVVSQKILFQEIATEINATLDTDNYLCNDTINIIYGVDAKFETKFILSLLNSKPINQWFKQVYPSGLHIKINQIETIPIPEISLENQQPFVALADQMLSLTAQLQQKTARFLSRITESYNLKRTTQALEAFYTLDFKAFATELGKQKIKLSLAQKDELEDYFNEKKSECAAIKTEIDETNVKIDKMVCELYGINWEEL